MRQRDPTVEQFKLNFYPKSRINPLKKTSFFLKPFFTWLGEMITIANKIPWEQGMNYDLTPYDTVAYHKDKIAEGLKKKKTILGMLFSVYKWNLLEYVFIGILLSSISFSNSYFVANVIGIIENNTDFKSPSVTKGLIINFGSLACVITLTALINSYYTFKSNRLSYCIRSSLLAVAQDKVMTFSTLNSTTVTEG